MQNWIKAACDELAQTNTALRFCVSLRTSSGGSCRGSVNSGVPIHIGARLFGHLSVETARGYVAVFDEDVIRHDQQFLEHRRQQRPQDECRPVTIRNGLNFTSTSTSGRSNSEAVAALAGHLVHMNTRCIRCPQLNVNPAMLPRLDVIETDLLERRGRAEKQGWLGEIEGIDLTLQFLRQKRSKPNGWPGSHRSRSACLRFAPRTVGSHHHQPISFVQPGGHYGEP